MGGTFKERRVGILGKEQMTLSQRFALRQSLRLTLDIDKRIPFPMSRVLKKP